MDIGMNLPVMVPGLDRRLLLEWSRRIDTGPFSTLAAGERPAEAAAAMERFCASHA